VLAAVVISASISLFDVAELRRLYRVRKSEFALAVACALGVALVGVLQGIVIAVILSMLYIFRKAWSPYSTSSRQARRRPWLARHQALPRCRAGTWTDHPALVGAPVFCQRERVP
jgi:MFS superfamily sulfate permease-like transporter